MTPADSSDQPKWYAMRDLARPNARLRAADRLAADGFEVFTPRHEVVHTIGGKKTRLSVPVVPDLLFVHAPKPELDPVVELLPTLQYRYRRGHSIHQPLTVRHSDMERFIAAVSASPSTRYYLPGELTEAMYGRAVRIVGGPLDGSEGRLLSIKGMRRRRLLVEIPDFLTAAVEVAPAYLQLL